MKPQEQQVLVRLNAQARMHSTQYALYVLGILSLVCIFSNRRHYGYKKEQA